MHQPSPVSCKDWLAGWHFTPAPDRLFQVIANPMATCLADEVLTVSIKTRGLRVELSLPYDQPSRCERSPSGIAFHLNTEEQSQSAYFFRNEPNCLIIETDDRRIGFASDGDVRESEDGTMVTASAGDIKIVLVIDWNALPVRMALISSSVDESDIATKARGMLFTSAKAAFDQQMQHGGMTPDLDPLETLYSFLQPVSPATPYPWTPDVFGNPVSDTPLHALITLATIPANRELAAGFIGNMVEQINTQGTLAMGRARDFPCVLQLIEKFHRQTGTWPHTPDDFFDRYTAYLGQLLESGQPHSGTLENKLADALCEGELQAWHYIHRLSGRPSDAQLDKIKTLARSLERGPGNTAPAAAWIEILRTRDTRLRDEQPSQAAAKEYEQLAHTSRGVPQKIALWTAGLLLCDTARDADAAWTSTMLRLADDAWRDQSARILSFKKIMADDATHAAVALGVWSATTRNRHQDQSSRTHHKAATLVRRKPALFTVIAAAIVLLAAGWLVSVQFRKNYSDKAFVTELGMIQQLYTSGDYDTALIKVDDMLQRKSLSEITGSFIKGKIFYNKGRFAEAVTCFEYCYAEEPVNPAYLYNLALATLAQGNQREAVDLFLKTASQYEISNPIISDRAKEAAKIIDSLGSR